MIERQMCQLTETIKGLQPSSFAQADKVLSTIQQFFFFSLFFYIFAIFKLTSPLDISYIMMNEHRYLHLHHAINN